MWPRRALRRDERRTYVALVAASILVRRPRLRRDHVQYRRLALDCAARAATSQAIAMATVTLSPLSGATTVLATELNSLANNAVSGLSASGTGAALDNTS